MNVKNPQPGKRTARPKQVSHPAQRDADARDRAQAARAREPAPPKEPVKPQRGRPPDTADTLIRQALKDKRVQKFYDRVPDLTGATLDTCHRFLATMQYRIVVALDEFTTAYAKAALTDDSDSGESAWRLLKGTLAAAGTLKMLVEAMTTLTKVRFEQKLVEDPRDVEFHDVLEAPPGATIDEPGATLEEPTVAAIH